MRTFNASARNMPISVQVSCDKAYQGKMAAGKDRHPRAPGFEEAGDFATATEPFNFAGQLMP